MPKTREQKEDEVKFLVERLKQARSVVFATYEKLPANKTVELRRLLREKGSGMRAAKKRLLKLALKQNDIDESVVDRFSGSVAAVFGYEDEAAPANVLVNFAKKNEGISVVGGILEHCFIEAQRVTALALLPSREELLATTVGTIKAPLSGLVNVLSGTMRTMVYVLNAIKEAKS